MALSNLFLPLILLDFIWKKGFTIKKTVQHSIKWGNLFSWIIFCRKSLTLHYFFFINIRFVILYAFILKWTICMKLEYVVWRLVCLFSIGLSCGGFYSPLGRFFCLPGTLFAQLIMCTNSLSARLVNRVIIEASLNGLFGSYSE